MTRAQATKHLLIFPQAGVSGMQISVTLAEK